MRVAIVHYWLINMRGGEKVLEALLEMFPQADVYTHVYNPQAVSALINKRRVYTSPINRLPLAKKLYQLYMPLMPRALMEFNLRQYDLVISSESGPAKGVVPHPAAFHVCYCHSPMRYLWDMYHEYCGKSAFPVRFFMRRFIPSLRLWDIASANLVDRFIANSPYVAKRIKRYYNRDADIVYPPAAIERFISQERRPEDFYLFFGQLAGYKRADIAIDACAASGRKLVVAGAGGGRQKRRHSGLISFTGRVPDGEIADLFSRAKALLFPGVEDFGIIPVEAAAAGCPVIAFRDGGALDTVKEQVTGLFFEEQNAASLIAAMDRFEQTASQFTDRARFTAHAEQFSKAVFIKRLGAIINERIRL